MLFSRALGRHLQRHLWLTGVMGGLLSRPPQTLRRFATRRSFVDRCDPGDRCESSNEIAARGFLLRWAGFPAEALTIMPRHYVSPLICLCSGWRRGNVFSAG